LYSRTLNVGGKLDLLIETEDACYPVDFKYTTGRPHRNHLLQLAGYSLLVSEHFSKPVPAGFIFIITDDTTFRFPMSDSLLSEARSALQSINHMIELETFPEPTPVRARCTDCEYRNFCGDVFRILPYNAYTKQLILNLPDELSAALSSSGQELSRAALEAIALEAYRERKVNAAQLRRI